MPAAFLQRPIPVLLGTTPPMKRSQPQRKEELVKQNVELVRSFGKAVDGVAVYDVWEGNERGKFRTKYGDNRPFAQRVVQETGKEAVLCNVVVHQGEAFPGWLDATTSMGLWNQVYVGASSEKFPVAGPHPREAYKYAANRHGGRVTLGAITIPWRFQEARRLAKKVELGARFALSQIMLEARSGIELIDALDKLVVERELEPPTLFWNFAPVADLELAREDFEYFEVFPASEAPEAHDLARKNWERIAGAREPLRESIQVAAENLEVLLEHTLRSRIKPGITAEGLGLQNLPHLEGLLRALVDVRARVVKRHYDI